MNEIFKLILSIIYLLVAVVSLMMAYECLSAKKYLGFQEKAFKDAWKAMSEPAKATYLFQLRISGLGFFVSASILVVAIIELYLSPDSIGVYLLPFVALIFCIGLFYNNLQLSKKIDSYAPWRGSLGAVIAIAVGILISFFR